MPNCGDIQRNADLNGGLMLDQRCRQWTSIKPTLDQYLCVCWVKTCHPLGYERVYLPLYKVADTPFHNPGGRHGALTLHQQKFI